VWIDEGLFTSEAPWKSLWHFRHAGGAGTCDVSWGRRGGVLAGSWLEGSDACAHGTVWGQKRELLEGAAMSDNGPIHIWRSMQPLQAVCLSG
jgi:hypothetical protein